MIRFFRNIRQKLAAENSVAKYLRYAIGEILLVVVGILIAFQINNWNENRKQEVVEREFLEGVKNDLIQDKEFIKLVIKNNEPKIKAYTLLNKENIEFYIDDKTSFDSLLRIYFVPQPTFYPVSGSFQSAIAGNEINAFKNKNVTHSLIKLYNSTYPRLADNGKMLDDRWDYLAKKYSHNRRIGHFRDLKDRQMSDLLDAMHHHFMQMQWYQGILNNTIEDIDAALQEIKIILDE